MSTISFPWLISYQNSIIDAQLKLHYLKIIIFKNMHVHHYSQKRHHSELVVISWLCVCIGGLTVRSWWTHRPKFMLWFIREVTVLSSWTHFLTRKGLQGNLDFFFRFVFIAISYQSYEKHLTSSSYHVCIIISWYQSYDLKISCICNDRGLDHTELNWF